MVVIEVPCRYCSQTHFVQKHGKVRSGLQRYLCTDCNRSFQLDYLNNANKTGTRERINEMTMNGSGVRDISRVLKISVNTVISHLKDSPLRR